MTLFSRITGLIRDNVFAQILGASVGPYADAFFVAFRIPNFFRRIFGEGAFSVAFIPVFTQYKEHGGEAEARRLVAAVAGRLGLILLGLCVIGVLAAPWLVTAIAPGFRIDKPDTFVITVDALRYTFPYLFFISLVAMSAGILNSYGRFAAPAATPVLLNLCLIGAAAWLVPIMPNAAIALSLGVLIAGVVQLGFQIPFLRKAHMLPAPSLKAHPGVGQIARLTLPALIGTSVAQINFLINTILASFLVTGSVSWLYYSDRLMEFPLGVFGIALATVILPDLSRQHVRNSMVDFSNLLDWSLRWVVLIVTPATVALIVLGGPILVTIFHYGAFTDHDAIMASKSLVAFAVGLLAFSLVKVLAPGFYARQNTRTPVRVAMLAMAVNIVFSLILVWPLAHVGLALATSISAVVNAGALFYLLRKDGVFQPLAGWPMFLVRVVAASALMGVMLWWGGGELEQWLRADVWTRILRLGSWVAAGIGVYFLGILILGIRPQQLLLNKPTASAGPSS